jgi:hypothetical protein
MQSVFEVSESIAFVFFNIETLQNEEQFVSNQEWFCMLNKSIDY